MRILDKMELVAVSSWKHSYLVGSKIIRNYNKLKRIGKKYRIVAQEQGAKKLEPFWAVVQRKKSHLQYWAEITKKKQKILFAEFRSKSILGQIKDIFSFLYAKKHTIWNYAAPLGAAVVLMSCFANFQSRTWALAVEYDGQPIGLIQSESVFNEAQRQVLQRIVNEEYIAPEAPNTRFTLMSVDPAELTDTFALSNQIIRASGNEITTASGLYVDDRFLGAVKEPSTLLWSLDGLLSPYREENPEAKVSFQNKIELKEGLYPVSGVVALGKVNQVLHSEVEGEVTYTVESGDTPLGISFKTETPYRQLLNLNPTIEKRLLPGQELVLSNAKNYLDVKLTKTETYTEKIPFTVEQVSDSKALKGYSSVTKQGVPGEKKIEAEVIYVNGKVTEKKIVSEMVTKKPQAQVVSVGTNVLSNTTSSNTALIWPVYGGISAGWYGYSGHTAIDITGSYGTPIRAAAAGKVVMVKNSYTGYGRHILIDHGAGVQTLYAHNSQLLVKVGDVVQQGEVIAKMGSTGNSSGNHCHFEVRIYGRFVNPMKYLP